MKDFKDMTTSDKYWYIIEHPAFMNDEFVSVNICVEPQNVCPITERIEDYKPLNTKVQYWIEFCPPYKDSYTNNKFVHSHDTDCDCGGWTYEEAIDNLFDLVIEKYGSYTDADLKTKMGEVFGTTKSVIWKRSIEDRVQALLKQRTSNKVEDPLEFTFLEKDIKNLKGTLHALTEHRKTANIDSYSEIDDCIQNCKVDISILEASLKIGMMIE